MHAWHSEFRPNESESLNSHQLSSSFGPGFSLLAVISEEARGSLGLPSSRPQTFTRAARLELALSSSKGNDRYAASNNARHLQFLK